MFWNRYFSELELGDRKISKPYQGKLKSGHRLWAFEIIYWKLRLYGKLFCIKQTLQLSQFCRVPTADLCASVIDTFGKIPLINSQGNLQPLQHLKWIFVWH